MGGGGLSAEQNRKIEKEPMSAETIDALSGSSFDNRCTIPIYFSKNKVLSVHSKNQQFASCLSKFNAHSRKKSSDNQNWQRVGLNKLHPHYACHRQWIEGYHYNKTADLRISCPVFVAEKAPKKLFNFDLTIYTDMDVQFLSCPLSLVEFPDIKTFHWSYVYLSPAEKGSYLQWLAHDVRDGSRNLGEAVSFRVRD